MFSGRLHGAVYAWQLPLNGQLPGCPRNQREGFLVRLSVDSHGKELFGVGDCAPLPGFSCETLSDAREKLEQVLRWLVTDVDDSLVNRLQAISKTGLPMAVKGEPDYLPSSVIFAVESAVERFLEACKQSTHRSSGSPAKVFPVCRLLTGDNQAIKRHAQALGRETTLVKMKVGRQSLTEDIQRIRLLAETLPSSVNIRLDANRSWSMNEALLFAQSISKRRIAFIEEPLQEAGQSAYQHYAASGGLPVAWDESLQIRYQRNSREPILVHGLAALVVKPTLSGGVYQCRKLAEFARAHHLELVLSASYESNIGVDQLAGLARELAPNVAPGLDTLSVFERYLLHRPENLYVAEKPILSLPQLTCLTHVVSS